MPDYFYNPDTVIVVSILTLILVGLIRGFRGGEFFEPDKNVADGIAGVTVFVMLLLWYGLIVDFKELLRWSERPLGRLSISMAMIWVISSRMQKIVHNCRPN
ncbi:MAG: hypothetical protein ABJ246_22070 [Paracoccaceae bacterium]